MDREAYVKSLESVLQEVPEETRPQMRKISGLLIEYADYELGFAHNDLKERLKILERKLNLFCNPRSCPKCGSDHLLKVISPRVDRGKTYCKGCGLMI